MSQTVRIIDVSPRDGLQNEAARIATADKAALVAAVTATGVDEVEITSFVSPQWVPQLGDARELCELVARAKPAGAVYSALVPNERGLDSLLEANAAAIKSAGRPVIDRAAVFLAASEGFSKKNTNASIAEVTARLAPVVERVLATGSGLLLRVYISCVFACPFDGPTDSQRVARLIEDLVLRWSLAEPRHRDSTSGVPSIEISLGDTIGRGSAFSTNALFDAIDASPWLDGARALWLYGALNLHLHDTFGLASECVTAGLGRGVRSFDGSVAGIGGCPYASLPGKPAPGNLDTERLVDAIHSAGYTTHIKPNTLPAAAALARRLIAAKPTA